MRPMQAERGVRWSEQIDAYCRAIHRGTYRYLKLVTERDDAKADPQGNEKVQVIHGHP